MIRDAYWRKCRVERVVDGDTVDLAVDLGYRLTTTQRIRLLGVNTPEMKNETLPAGRAARLFAIGWFGMHAHGFDRWLGLVECGEGHVLNDDLVLYGYAQLYTGRRA